MATVRQLSVAIASDRDLAALAATPRLLPSLTDLTLGLHTPIILNAAAWRGAFQALLSQLTALSLDGWFAASLADPSIFTNWSDHPAGPVNGGGGFRRPRSGSGERLCTAPDGVANAAATPATTLVALPLERLRIGQASGSHGPLFSFLAAHAPNLTDVEIVGDAAPAMIDALAAMPRCRSLTLVLHGLTDEHIARILRSGMRDSLRNCNFTTDSLRGFSAFAPRFMDLAAFDGVVCPKVRKPTHLPCNDCTRSVFPNARWPEETTAVL
jgi:hypothetical protein